MEGSSEVGGWREKLPFAALSRPPSSRRGAPQHPPPERELMPPPPGSAIEGGPERPRLSSGQLGLDLRGLRTE
eukprot:5765827-Alexandrium_andersonii.AAC.1